MPTRTLRSNDEETRGGKVVYHKKARRIIPFDTPKNRATALLLYAIHPEEIEFINNNDNIPTVSQRFLSILRDIIRIHMPKYRLDSIAAALRECDNVSNASNQEDETVELDNQEDKEQQLDVCAVCLDDISRENVTIGALDCCEHKYHNNCIRRWLTREKSCPLCRRTPINIEVIIADWQHTYRRLCVALGSDTQ